MAEKLFPAPAEAHEEIMDLAVVGAGMAGLAAGVFAARRGLKTALLGSTGGLAYTTGYLDLLSAPRRACEPYYSDPAEAVAALVRDNPGHPYCRTTARDIGDALREFTDFLAEAGLPYVVGDANMLTLSPVGTVKSTYAVPATMLAGVEALRAKTPCLLLDFIGLKGFSARGIAAAAREVWPDITPRSLPFPDMAWAGELYPEAMARSLEVPAAREALAASIRPHLGAARCVGLPAVLGVHDSVGVQRHLAELLGVPVFEIPTLPPGVPGIRLRESIDDALRGRGATLFAQRHAFGVGREDGLFRLEAGETAPEFTLRAKSLILATGRFLSGGLVADRVRGIVEPLLHLPVAAPENRDDWHREDYFDPAGHAVHRAGLATDRDFRPLDAAGAAVDPDLYAAGSILAGQDWVWEKSGAGIAVASARAAVNAIARRREAV